MTPTAIHIPQRTVAREALPNGTTMLYAPNPYNQIVAIRILSRMASRHETAEKAGMANLCMRLISAGTQFHDEEEIADNLEQNGAHYKAEAGKDWSTIDLLTTMHSLQEDLQTLMEVLDFPIFPEDKLEREREIVRMTILEQEDSHLTYTMRIFRERYYGSHPYSWPSIGLLDALENVQRDDLVGFAQAALAPSQLVVSVVGGGESGEVQKIIRDAFAVRDPRARICAPEVSRAAPAFQGYDEVFASKETESEYLVLGYPGAGMTEPAAIPLRVIGTILGGSMDSRLFREIRDKRGLCYQVGSSYAPNQDHSPLLVYVVTTAPNRQEAITCTEAEIEKLKSEAVGEEELERVKNYICGTYVMSMETNMGQAIRYATYEIAGLGWEYTNRLTEDINQVTPEDILDTAKTLFTQRLLAVTASE